MLFEDDLSITSLSLIASSEINLDFTNEDQIDRFQIIFAHVSAKSKTEIAKKIKCFCFWEIRSDLTFSEWISKCVASMVHKTLGQTEFTL